MMDQNVIDVFINSLDQIFNLGYYISVVVGVYLILKLIDYLNKEKVLTEPIKQIVTVLTGFVFGLIFYYIGDSIKALIPSFLFSIFSYDYAIKYLLRKTRLSYKKRRSSE
jgi:hypothetical protein